MNGYSTRLLTDLVVDHHKPRNVSQGGAVSRKWQMGVRDWALGYDPLFEFIKCAGRILHPAGRGGNAGVVRRFRHLGPEAAPTGDPRAGGPARPEGAARADEAAPALVVGGPHPLGWPSRASNSSP